MLLSEIQPELLSREQITNLVFGTKGDDGKAGDCIFVFGGKATRRVVKAAELYHNKRAPYIMLTGSGIRWGKNEQSEAEWMREKLLKMGVPDEALLLETESANTTENVLASLLVLERKIGLEKIKRILIVSSPSHMRRCLLTLQTYMPSWIEYSMCEADRTSKNNWWENPDEEKAVLHEVEALAKYSRQGIIKDEEVEI
ncbi:YdcF family protein [Fictibacillus gelatini]|uniref:YdcF family protein n=1 Tax=Fictibacillus gelatini TaxID=225985 RepID=UPI000421FDD8|nr:YdcF family protein [Fictibacillus gelatini]